MERLPSLLMSTIENACEQFSNISFTVHGENDRARISIVFTNQEISKSKRKSNSTVNRDRKRMKEYNNDNVHIENSENDTDVICSDSLSENNHIPSGKVSTNISDVMDFDDNPCEASASTGNINSVESPNIELLIDTGNELPMSPTCLPSKIINNGNKSKQRVSVDIIEKNPSTCDKVKEHNKNIQDSRFIHKIVLKQNRSGTDILIGKTQRGRLVLFHIDHKEFEVLLRGERDYRIFNKVVTDDFKDVRTTKLMTDAVRQGILEMEKLVENKKL